VALYRRETGFHNISQVILQLQKGTAEETISADIESGEEIKETVSEKLIKN